MSMCVTQGLLDTWSGRADGRAWLADHHRLKRAAAARWDLEVGPLFPGSNVSFVWQSRRRDGTHAVLKLNFAEEDSRHEPDALRRWDGRGAVRLIDHDPVDRALVLERAHPGDALSHLPDEIATEVAAGILRSFRVPPQPGVDYRTLDAVSRGWQAQLRAARSRDARGPAAPLLREAIALIDELTGTATEVILLHQDLHSGNILWDEERGWLAIDPKPLVGDPAFDAASLLRDRPADLLADPRADDRVRRRVDQLVDLLGLDRDRVIAWGIVHALAWGVSSSGDIDESLVRSAQLILEAA